LLLKTVAGTALIENFKILHDGNVIDRSGIVDLIMNRTGLNDLYQKRLIYSELSISDTPNGFYLPKDRNLQLLSVMFRPETKDIKNAELDNLFNKIKHIIIHEIDIQFEYNSIYEEKPRVVRTKEANKKYIEDLVKS